VSQITPDDLLKALARMGFWGRTGANHTVLVYVVDGRKTRIRTVVDRHGKPFGEARISDYVHQLGLERAEFDRLMDGTMTPDEYKGIVVSRGRI
jgi:hypothetical protein